jgi:hypothetical protein
MKPLPITQPKARKFPLVEYHYHASALSGASAPCKTRSKSLRDISRDYFDSEAKHDFLSEAAAYLTLVLSTVVPVVTGASAVAELFRTLPLF